ncbi:MAG: hypothetical protein HQ557_08845 [Bacteroidetes bacterium]|nr:hypothetical protein [Bacteroidota bacterium]
MKKKIIKIQEIVLEKTVYQIIGTKKNIETKKAIRYCKERSIPFHFVDLNERSLSAGELQNIFRVIDPINMIDTNSSTYKKRGYAYMEFDPIEELLEYPHLLKIPVIRAANKVLVSADLKELDRFFGKDQRG